MAPGGALPSLALLAELTRISRAKLTTDRTVLGNLGYYTLKSYFLNLHFIILSSSRHIAYSRQQLASKKYIKDFMTAQLIRAVCSRRLWRFVQFCTLFCCKLGLFLDLCGRTINISLVWAG